MGEGDPHSFVDSSLTPYILNPSIHTTIVTFNFVFHFLVVVACVEYNFNFQEYSQMNTHVYFLPFHVSRGPLVLLHFQLKIITSNLTNTFYDILHDIK